jgi:glyoxylase-like metal-dependent hydrolase (beta-lactamase superfamily II)
MALEIKILDYGDIELESSFLMLGRDCGRPRRVFTYGFFILGGPWPIVVDTGYRSNQIMETLGMRGLQFHENMIENQLARHGVRMGDVRYVLHTHLHIDHAGKTTSSR